ncbi:MAG: TIGR00304 family membrane protein [Candidatus Natronoplasma sp.]
MDKRNMIPISVLLAGIFLVIFSIMEGEAKIGLLFIVPIIYGTGAYLALGILLIFFSFIMFFLFLGHSIEWKEIKRERTKAHEESSYGGVIFVGPIPIIFGKDKSVAKKMMYLGLLIALILAAIYLAVVLI